MIAVADIPYPWIRQELVFAGPHRRPTTHLQIKLIQELLNFAGEKIGIDSDFGPATETATKNFQARKNLPSTGIVDSATFDRLIEPILLALTPLPAAGNYKGMVANYAAQHLAVHPIEIGGENSGVWVRLYMKGYEGPNWLWCAGFVSLILNQANLTKPSTQLIGESFSCDVFAEKAKSFGRFIVGGALPQPPHAISPGDLFLVRRSPGDWQHIGIVTAVQPQAIETIEGNTNQNGSANGFEVCRRIRAYKNLDFISIV